MALLLPLTVQVCLLFQFQWLSRINVARTPTPSSCTVPVHSPVLYMRPASNTICCTARLPSTRSGRASRCTDASITGCSDSSRTRCMTSSLWRATATASVRSQTWSLWRQSGQPTDHVTFTGDVIFRSSQFQRDYEDRAVQGFQPVVREWSPGYSV